MCHPYSYKETLLVVSSSRCKIGSIFNYFQWVTKIQGANSSVNSWNLWTATILGSELIFKLVFHTVWLMSLILSKSGTWTVFALLTGVAIGSEKIAGIALDVCPRWLPVRYWQGTFWSVTACHCHYNKIQVSCTLSIILQVSRAPVYVLVEFLA